MRKFALIAALVLLPLFAKAQGNDVVKSGDLYPSNMTTISEGKGELMRFHGRLIFAETNQYLGTSDVTGEFWRKYQGARILQNYGQYLWILGASSVATDLVFRLLYLPEGHNYLKDPSLILGGVCALIGGAMDFGGWLKLGKLAGQYNTDPSVRREYSLVLGPASSGGFGLSLYF